MMQIKNSMDHFLHIVEHFFQRLKNSNGQLFFTVLQEDSNYFIAGIV